VTFCKKDFRTRNLCHSPPTLRLASADAETGYGGRVEGQAGNFVIPGKDPESMVILVQVLRNGLFMLNCTTMSTMLYDEKNNLRGGNANGKLTLSSNKALFVIIGLLEAFIRRPRECVDPEDFYFFLDPGSLPGMTKTCARDDKNMRPR
jgi:hypothetical protein